MDQKTNYKVDSHNFTKEEIEKSGGVIYDPSSAPASAPKDLPDPNKILDTVYEILEYMATDEIVQLKATDNAEYSVKLEEKFPEFADRYYALFRQVISGNDLTQLFNMLGYIAKVKNGEATVEEVEKDVGRDLSGKYYKAAKQ